MRVEVNLGRSTPGRTSGTVFIRTTALISLTPKGKCTVTLGKKEKEDLAITGDAFRLQNITFHLQKGRFYPIPKGGRVLEGGGRFKVALHQARKITP